MERTYLPLVLTLLALVTAAWAVWKVVALNRSGGLKDLHELIQALIGISLCMGASVSAIFAIYAYLRANEAFIESQRPQLLIQVVAGSPKTVLHYRNPTGNRFADLSLSIEISARNRSIDLSDLFGPPKPVPGLDDRRLQFETVKELRERGLDLESAVASGSEIVLRTKYTYTFNGEKNTDPGPEYRWETESRGWSIR